MDHILNAENKVLGRLATEIARLLRGKHKPSFRPNILSSERVVIFNTDRIRVTGKKLSQKVYRHHSGYHGGLKQQSLKDIMAHDSRIALRRAVMGMLPKNKLRPRMIKNLELHKGEYSRS